MLCLPFTCLVSGEHPSGPRWFLFPFSLSTHTNPFCGASRVTPSPWTWHSLMLCVLQPSPGPTGVSPDALLLCPAENAQPGILQSKDSLRSTKIKQEKPAFVAPKLCCLLGFPSLAAAARTRSSTCNSACGLNMISVLILQPFPFSSCLPACISARIRSQAAGRDGAVVQPGAVSCSLLLLGLFFIARVLWRRSSCDVPCPQPHCAQLFPARWVCSVG